MSANGLTENEMRLLSEVLCGDRSERDLEVQTAAVANPTFRKRLAELQGLRAVLEAAGRSEREILATAAEPAAPADAALVAATLGRLARPPRAQRRPWAWFAAAAAAAALLLVSWWAGAFSGRTPGGDDHRQLAGDVFSGLSTRPAADGGIDFVWSCSLERVTFVVTITDPLDLLWTPVQSLELNDARWHVDASTVANLPKTAHWRVSARVIEDGGVKTVDSRDLPLR